MNASARPPTCLSSRCPADFGSLLPLIERQLGYPFRRVPAPIRQDVLQEGLVRAFVIYRRLVDQGRQDQIFATPLARFAVLRIRDSRHVGSRRNRRDVSCPFVARRRGFRVERIDRFNPRAGCWSLMAIPSSVTPVPEQVAFRLDFPRWLSVQSDRNQKLILALASGDTTSEAAQRFHISAARVSQLRLQFFRSWRASQQDNHDIPARAAA